MVTGFCLWPDFVRESGRILSVLSQPDLYHDWPVLLESERFCLWSTCTLTGYKVRVTAASPEEQGWWWSSGEESDGIIRCDAAIVCEW